MKKIANEEKSWAKFVAKLWNLEGQYELLNSEFDINFELNEVGGKKFVVKIMRENYHHSFLDTQVKIMKFLREEEPSLPIPKIIESVYGNPYELTSGPDKKERIIWVLEKMRGVLLSDASPRPKSLMLDLGQKIAIMDLACARFKNNIEPQRHKWDLTKPLWIEDNISEISDSKLQKTIKNIVEDFLSISDKLDKMPHQWIHNDLNDQNLLVGLTLEAEPVLSGILDFGDISKGPTICNVAICSAYLLILPGFGLNLQLEFLRGYHSRNPLSEEELDILYTLVMTRLAVSFVNSVLMARGKPNDPYVVISQENSKKFLSDMARSREFLTARFRNICDFPSVKGGDSITRYLNSSQTRFNPIFKKCLKDSKVISLDPGSSILPDDPHSIKDKEATNLTNLGESEKQNQIVLGKYLEPRLIYTSKDFRRGTGKNSDRRTIHLGIDVFIPAGTEVFNPLDGKVVHSDFSNKHLDYGGFVVIEHKTSSGILFYSLFGHLDPNSIPPHIGGHLGKGDILGRIGEASVNGGWEPHLHLQLALGLGQESNWPGVCDPDDISFWSEYCPNPGALLGIKPESISFTSVNKDELVQNRIDHFSGNLKLSYKDPILLLRAYKNYMFDESGRCYLDFYNNVPHVGHSHPRIADLVSKQLKLINSNTRYLHPSQKKLSDKILSKFPSQFEVVFFVNSGSEANELALRLAKTYRGNSDFITFDHGYHGNTNLALEISPYKFNKPNGIGKKDWVHIIDCPNKFREVDPRYQINDVLKNMQENGRNLGGFVSEIFPSVAGQIVPQEGVLKYIYTKVRELGGLCIADEVQTGLGRLGDYYFAFEQQEVLPDIVVMGKPIGNGYPIGAVVTTKAIAEAFNNGIEFFSTFGGSNLSCLIANEVLQIVDDERLRENAKEMGVFLEDGLLELKHSSRFIGDIRGMGLFWGVEIVRNLGTKEPGACEADYICNRLREERILIGLEGPNENVLKLRPPLCIVEDDIGIFLKKMKIILRELSLMDDMEFII